MCGGFCVSTGSARSQAQIAKPPRQKARIHSGGGVGPQPKALEQGVWSKFDGSDCEAHKRFDRRCRRGRAVFERWPPTWWDPRGKMGMLHKFNPVRLGFIKEAACRQFERDPKRLDSLTGLRILDIGCGAGILSEPLARLGATVVGADPAEANIEAAKLHAAEAGLAIDYRATTAEALADAGERFDMVLAMEVVEHVADLALFVKRCAEMVKPGGLMITATINRTLKSFALAIVGAEYVLRWLPRGTHQWDKFVTPNELEAALARHGLTRDRGHRRDLQPHRRPLAALRRHGRELHGHGGEGTRPGSAGLAAPPRVSRSSPPRNATCRP